MRILLLDFGAASLEAVQKALAGQGYELAVESGLTAEEVLALSPEVLITEATPSDLSLLWTDRAAQNPPGDGFDSQSRDDCPWRCSGTSPRPGPWHGRRHFISVRRGGVRGKNSNSVQGASARRRTQDDA